MRSVHLVKEAAKKAGAKYYGRNMESNQRRLNIYLSQRFVQYNFCSMDQFSTEGVWQKPPLEDEFRFVQENTEIYAIQI